MAVKKPFRIVMHWSVTGYKVTAYALEHYHSITDGDGKQWFGPLKPEANNDTSDGVYVAHTGGFNTGAIGMAVAAMAGAEERPFKPGNSRIKMKQLQAFVEDVAQMANTYGIPVDRKHVLMHSEVEIIHGVKQRGKWDLNWLPGMSKPAAGTAEILAVGDNLRQQIRAAQSRLYPKATKPKFSFAKWWAAQMRSMR